MIFPTHNEFDKWPLHVKWGFFGSLVGVAGFLLYLLFDFRPFGADEQKYGVTSEIDFPSDEIVGRSDTRRTLPDTSAYAAAAPVAFDTASFDTMIASFEKRRQDDQKFYDELLADREAEANESLERVCKFTEGVGRTPASNLTTFIQRYNGIDSPKLGDDLALSLENKLVDWSAKVFDVLMHEGAAWVVVEAVDNPCPKEGCASSAMTRMVVRYDKVNEFVQNAKKGDYFRVQGLVQFMSAEKNKNLPAIARMVIDPLSTQYRTERTEGCQQF